MNIDMTALATQILLDAGFFDLARTELDKRLTEVLSGVEQERQVLIAARQRLETEIQQVLELKASLQTDISGLQDKAEEAISAARGELNRSAELVTRAVANFDQKVSEIHKAAQDEIAGRFESITTEARDSLNKVVADAEARVSELARPAGPLPFTPAALEEPTERPSGEVSEPDPSDDGRGERKERDQ